MKEIQISNWKRFTRTWEYFILAYAFLYAITVETPTIMQQIAVILNSTMLILLAIYVHIKTK